MSSRLMKSSVAGALLVVLCAATLASAQTVTFTLLTWTNDWTTNLPTAMGLKPSYNNTNDGAYTTLDSDWLVFTPDDKPFPGANWYGAFSHKFNDRVGLSGLAHGGYESANSLTGYVTIAFTEATSDLWNVELQKFSTVGSKTASTTDFSYSYLVTTNLVSIATNAQYGVNGLGNTGVWHNSADGNWAVSFRAQSYAKTPSVEHTEIYEQCRGYVIPVDQLTTGGMAQTSISDPSGYYTNSTEDYLVKEIAPRLPASARYLLYVELLKTHILFSTDPAHVNSNYTFFGECWFATTPDEIVPEPGLLACIGACALWLLARRKR